MKRLPTLIMLAVLLVLLFLIYKKPEKGKPIAAETRPAASIQRQPVMISQVAPDPQNSQHLYVATFNAGIFKSVDRGKSWASTSDGLKTLMVQDLVIAPRPPHVLYAATFGGGIYRSEKEGTSWTEVNEGLTNTSIPRLVFHPADPHTLYAMSLAAGAFKSRDEGRSWIPLPSTPPSLELRSNAALMPLPIVPSILYLATGDGLFTLKEGGSWEPVNSPLKGALVTALAYRPQGQVLIAAFFSQGLFRSDDFGKNWRPLGNGLKQGGIHSIALDPSDPMTLYVASTEQGLLKSIDGGESWMEINNGLQKKAAQKVVIDPRDPQVLYAAPSQGGLLFSDDSGKSWRSLDLGFPEPSTVIQALSDRIDKSLISAALAPPEAFKKCNLCHGWTDPALNLKPNKWRVAPSHREWTFTVKRMRKMIPDLTDGEETTLIQFLNENFGRSAAPAEKGIMG
jgi:photosystem II stability/assembly factor-like uncharacterized protein